MKKNTLILSILMIASIVFLPKWLNSQQKLAELKNTITDWSENQKRYQAK